MTVIAHLTDIHLPPVPVPQLRELSLKRLLGFLNWHRSRKFLHNADVVERIVRDLKQQNFDHLIVSGDLVNLALEAEFVAGAEWMARLGPTENISFVPGNHDYYGSAENFTARTAHHGTASVAPLSAYMQSDYHQSDTLQPVRDFLSGAGNGPLQSFLKVVGEVAIIGLNSAIPTPPFKAYGELDAASLAFLEDCLPALKRAGFYRCVVLHHPPIAGLTPARRALRNAQELNAQLVIYGAELVLYGHNHRQQVNRLETSDGFCHVVGTPSASICKAGPYDRARYNLFHIERTKDSWKTSMQGRGLIEDYGAVNDLGNTLLD